jgi:DNA-binding response OmpR family regulator
MWAVEALGVAMSSATGTYDDHVEGNALTAGTLMLLCKPFDPSALQFIIAGGLDDSKPAA